MNKKTKFIVLVVVAVLGLGLARDFLIKSVIGTVASNVTGSPTSIGGLSLGLFRQSIRISNFRMYNPKGFPRDILADIPVMGVVLDLGALPSGRIHLKQLDLEIKEIGLVKNKDGKRNVDSLKITTEGSGEKKKKPVKQSAMQIDIANLGMGRVVSKDYSVEGGPMVKVYDVNLTKSYKNITSAQQLAALIISEPLKEAGIQGLKMYGVSMLTGAAALPVAAAFTFAGKDYAQETFNVAAEKAYDAGLEVVKTAGRVRKENKAGGVISAEVNGVAVTLRLKKISEKSTQISISARRFGLPRPEVASGIMYRLKEQLR